MRYHLFLNFVGKMVKIARTFCLDLAVRRYMSTSVYFIRKIRKFTIRSQNIFTEKIDRQMVINFTPLNGLGVTS